jgi:CheY-like chemotaxis protein
MDGRRARVLVIDDDPHFARLVGKMVGREHDVTVATGAQEALATIGAGKCFDLSLCDLMMAGLSGVDFHERLGAMAPEQCDRAVYMTGGAFTPRTQAFLERPSIRHLEKPFGLVELQRLVREHGP